MPGRTRKKKKKSSDERILLFLISVLIFLVLVLIVGGVFLYAQIEKKGAMTVSPAIVAQPMQKDSEENKNLETVKIFFLSPADFKLVAEPHDVLRSRTEAQEVKRALQALLEGPRSPDLKGTTPPQSQVLAVFHDTDEKMVFLDMNASFYRNLPGHLLAEWAAIYSVVNTVCGLSEKIQSVTFLEEGKTVTESPGLWDWSHAFEPDLAWVRYTIHGDEPPE